MLMSKTTMKVDAELKAEYEKLFEKLNGVKPVTSSFIDNTLEKEIEKLKKELSKKKQAFKSELNEFAFGNNDNPINLRPPSKSFLRSIGT